MSIPAWLNTLAEVSLGLAILCALWIAIDVVRHHQHMAIMNVVWPLTALWSGPVGLAAYYAVGRKGSESAMKAAKERGEDPPGKRKPFWQKVGIGATHCGSGCTLGDIVAESLVVLVPVTLFGSHVFGTWAVDFVFAFLLGIVFQYYSIKPMRGLSPKDGLIAAVRADTLSLISWQVGMYGGMAIALFGIFGPENLPKSTPTFWFVMQIAMFLGFFTAYPVNWWLIRKGWKEAM